MCKINIEMYTIDNINIENITVFNRIWSLKKEIYNE